MNETQTNNKHISHRQTFSVAIMLLLLVVICGHAAAQNQPVPSTDRDNPAQLASNVITGDGVDDKTEYFYSFTAGPGEIKLTLDVKAEKSTAVSSVDIALYDANSRKLLSTYANPDHGSSKRAVETTKVRGEQTLLLGVTVSQGVDNFKIKLDGAVKIAPSTSGATDSSTSGGTTPPPAASSSQSQPTDIDTANAASSATDNSTAAGGSGAASNGANANATGAASNGADASQTSAPASNNGSKVGKVNAKINSASSALSAIITNANATADSVKSAKKKKQ